MQSHRLIFQARSLLGRNPPVIRIPAASGGTRDIERATEETRWSNEAIRALERRSLFSPMQESDDAQCEAFGGWEVYLTEAYDKIDFERGESENDRDYERRIDKAIREAGLPFGIRPLDPLSTLIDPTDDGEGINAALIVEKKRYRPLKNRMRRRYGEDSEEYRRISEGDFGESGFGTTSPLGEVETIRYYDPVWYAYMVNGALVEVKRHGLPGVPVFPAWGFVTSARNMGDKFQGVAYALTYTEPIANDLLTQETDSRLTYNQPKPIASAEADAPAPDEDTLDLSGSALRLLPPGYKLDDAYRYFRSQNIDPTISMLLGLGQGQSLSPVVSGQSPSADSSGFSLNLLTSNAIGPYMPLIQNKATAVGKMVDFLRRMVRDTIREPVSLPTIGKGEADEAVVEWITLTPDGVTDIPAQVQIDPQSDAERIAIAEWLASGVERQVVPERILQERGYGADDVEHWNEEIDRDAARKMMRPLRVQQAMLELQEEAAMATAPPVIFGPNGQPVSTGDLQQAGGLPVPPEPSTVGRENVAGPGNVAGQRPQQQPFTPGDPGV